LVNKLLYAVGPFCWLRHSKKNMEISKTQPFFMRKGQIGILTPMSFEELKSILLADKVELNTLDCVQNIRNGGLLP